MKTTPAACPDGMTTAGPHRPMQRLDLTSLVQRLTGATPSNNAPMRATTRTHVGSIGTMTRTKRQRNRKRGRIGMTSNAGFEATPSAAGDKGSPHPRPAPVSAEPRASSRVITVLESDAVLFERRSRAPTKDVTTARSRLGRTGTVQFRTSPHEMEKPGPLETLRRLRKEFRAAHAKGTAALKSGDYHALGEAIDAERKLMINRSCWWTRTSPTSRNGPDPRL
jgi:hypothetical protein